MRGYDDANVHADPASLVLSGRVRGPGQVDRVQLGEAIEIFIHLKNGTPHAIENGKLGGCAGSCECSVRGIHKVPDRLPLVRLFQRTEADLIFCGSSEMDDPHFFALLRGEGAHGKVQWGDAGAFPAAQSSRSIPILSDWVFTIGLKLPMVMKCLPS